MKKKNPLKKLFVSSLMKSFYLNVVEFQNQKGKWSPIWYSKWAGADNRTEAVKLRKQASTYLHAWGNKCWRDGKNIKTVKINLFSK